MSAADDRLSGASGSEAAGGVDLALDKLRRGDIDGAVEIALALPVPLPPHGVALAMALADILLEVDAVPAAMLLRAAALTAEADGSWAEASEACQLEIVAAVRSLDAARAQVAYRKAEELGERIDDPFDAAVALINLAARLNDAGMNQESVTVGERARWEASQLPGAAQDDEVVRVMAAATVNLASALLELGALSRVGGLLGEAEVRYRRLGDEIHLGNVKVNQAMLASVEGRIHDEREAYNQAAAHYEAGEAPPGDVGFAVRGEAASLAQVGRYPEAIERYQQAHDLFVDAGLLVEARRTVTGLVMARSSNDEALPPTELDALEAELDEMAPSDAADRARNLANIALAQGDPARAFPLYARALDSYTRLGRSAEAARVRSSRAAAHRRTGDLVAAAEDLRVARSVLEAEGRSIQAANADHNIALVLRDMANRDNAGAGVERLRTEALDRSLQAISTLDRFRHSLPSAADRRSVQARTYAPIFPLAVQLATQVGVADETAALVERTRIQPVLAATTGTEQHRFADPAPVAARRGSRPIGGSGPVVTLATLARHLLGSGAAWHGWWVDGPTLLRIRVTPTTTFVDSAAWDREPLVWMESALAIPNDQEIALAEGSDLIASCLALARAARGPLLGDAGLAAGAEAALPAHLVSAGRGGPIGGAIDDAELLWPVARLLFGEDYLAHLVARDLDFRERLVVAPAPVLGHVPWAALPVEDPRQVSGRDVRRLVEVADVVIGLPASLARVVDSRSRLAPGAGHLLVRDPLGDLRFARQVDVGGARVLGHGASPATRRALRAELARGARQLTICGHVRPGEDDNPARSAILLADEASGTDAVTVGQLRDLAVPATCVLLACDGAGAATGAEWTGVATGLVWAGARWVVTTTWPAIDDAASAASDSRLLESIDRLGPYDGTWEWQRGELARRREIPGESSAAPHRWAGTIVTGVGGRAGSRRWASSSATAGACRRGDPGTASS